MKAKGIYLVIWLSVVGYAVVAQTRMTIPNGYLVKFQGYKANNRRAMENSMPTNMVSVVDLLPPNCDKTGKFDYTSLIQTILKTHSKLVFPNFPLKINENGLHLQSNSTLYFPEGSILTLSQSSKSGYSILHLNKVSNVKVYFPVLVGDRENHIGSTGEWGMGIKIISSKNVEIVGASISKCWGDGIYVGSDKGSITDKVLVRNSLIDYNRRNGISIISARNVTIASNIISNTSGTQPMAGIDVEPNSNDDVISNVVLRDNFSFNNANHGVLLLLNRLKGIKRKSVSVALSQHVDENSTYGLGLSFPTVNRKGLPLTGTIIIEGSTWRSSRKQALYNFSGSKINGLTLKFKNNNIVRDNGEIDYDKLKKMYKEFKALGFLPNEMNKYE